MRRRRRRKSFSRFYIIMSIICLLILFMGYSTAYKLAQARKASQEVSTISISDEAESTVKRYNELFARVMSYFNIFFKETFIEYDENGMFDDKIYGTESKEPMETVTSDEKIDISKTDTYDNSKYDNAELYKTTIVMASDRKANFFTMAEAINTASRMSTGLREIVVDSDKINENTNIIIYHTHATESFRPAEDDNYHSKNENYNIMGIGKKIADNLTKYGIDVKHIDKYNDIPSYDNSYQNSKKAIIPLLDENKKNMIIDIHRDGAEPNSNYEDILRQNAVVSANGLISATFSIVIGGNNDNIEELKKIANELKIVSDEMYPGLCRGVVIREHGSYNQSLSDDALLIELGSHINTIDEARNTANLLSEILCKTVAKINN